MGVVWLRARAQLRGRLLASLLLTLLVGLAGGVVLAAAALGVGSAPVVPLLPIVAASAATLLAANLAAAGPGWAASRLQPAAALRSE
jgi:ABC-type antimicrobial peptide transport system permease subunit